MPLALNATDETQVNAEPGVNLFSTAMLTLADGSYVISWTDGQGRDGHGDGIFAQRFDAHGQKIGTEFQVNTVTEGQQGFSQMTALHDGGFVITWTTTDGGYHQSFQRYDAQGQAVGVETSSSLLGGGTQGFGGIATLSDGTFVVTEQIYGHTTGGAFDIYAQIFSATGTAIGDPIRVSTSTSFSGAEPLVTGLASGGFVVTWNVAEAGSDGSFADVVMQVFDATHQKVGGETLVTTGPVNHTQSRNDITAMSDGGYLVTWSSYAEDGWGYGIYAQRFNASGTATGPATLVNTTTRFDQTDASVTVLSDGDYVISWFGTLDSGYEFGGFAQLFDAAGHRIGDEFLINQTSPYRYAGYQTVTALPDGGFAAAWINQDHIGDSYTEVIKQRLFSGDASAATSSQYVFGSTGNDLLTGTTNGDNLFGGAGNDTYIVDNAGDVVHEDAGAGTDTVRTAISCTLGVNLENVVLTGSENINATGNGVRNTLTGNSGNNILDGGKGIDTMIGGAGNDTYFVDNVAEIIVELHGGGNDTVYSSSTYTLSADIEKLILTGTGNTIATGNAINNTLIGNDGNNKLLGGDGADTLGGGGGNDTLDGGKGIDSMKGGAGNDKYYLDTSADVVTEYSSGGNDTVQINGTYTLTANVENLIIVGSSNRFGTGNASDNHITGNSGNNTLGGADGNDIIDGGKGADLMRGGTGDDVFYVDNAGDVVSEYSNAGTDLVYSSVSFILGGNVENLTLTGAANLNATGNSIDNILIGNAGNNLLSGGRGHDLLTGGLGADTLVFGPNSGADTVSDFSVSEGDHIDLHAYTHGTANLALISQIGADTVIDLGGGNIITVQNTTNDSTFVSHLVW